MELCRKPKGIGVAGVTGHGVVRKERSGMSDRCAEAQGPRSSSAIEGPAFISRKGSRNAMKRWCPRGTQYWNEMDMKLAWGAAIVAGKTVTNSYCCDNCGAFHLGHPKRIDNICQMTRKITYGTEAEASEALRRIAEKREQGFAERQEARVYQCPTRHPGCGKWHLTKEEK